MKLRVILFILKLYARVNIFKILVKTALGSFNAWNMKKCKYEGNDILLLQLMEFYADFQIGSLEIIVLPKNCKYYNCKNSVVVYY